MSWIPPNLAESCAVYTNLTSCQPPTFLFLQLITQLFGQSLDSEYDYGQSGYDFGSNIYGYPGSDEYHKPREREYDFIVLGAGSAGCVLANRLTEIPSWSVLLLEAGDEEPEVADVPAFAPALQQSSIDWGFSTQPDPNSCLARQNGQCSWARGRVMGGSSTINYMIYIRGNPRDYDEWAEAGNPGWSWREVLPYFMKSEDNHNIDTVERQAHGVGGYLSVERFQYQESNVRSLFEAFQELGLPVIDQNAGRQIGTMMLQTTTRSGRRESANLAFIRPIRRKRKNLTIETKAYIIRVLIDPHTKVAFGVEYEKNGKLIQVRARKEVIVSCGTIMTPKVLMLSGVGPAHHLQNFGIQVIKDLAVGYNLMDHPTTDGVLLQINNESATLVPPEQVTRDVFYYREEQAGPLSSTGPLQVNTFVQTKYELEPGRPDMQYSIDTANVVDYVTDLLLASGTKVYPLAYYNGFIIRPILLNQRSRGVIKLNSTDPIYGYPLIYSNTFNEQIDALTMVEGIKQSLNLLKTRAMQRLGVSLITTPVAACDGYSFGTDDYWLCLVRSYTSTMYHYAGTCKMGPKHDPFAVVDPKLRVYGIKNLRVIDTSIMPRVTRGNTNAPTIMIAEKGSDFIKETWLKKKFSIPKIPKMDFKQMIKTFFFNH
ncbi:glucose dehydrogenase [FAD, quinone]-like [Tribolium madens]|uniref:glucose dehydrogenase [FAD, quinone]-like n=1 Tax=Tribolium madens TaxID=41895 RepID=UPI001CF733A7|nr:glucose dehydrogenase [FAD, quinone]-like [Tribolium madens]